jgi:hypothetical protein
VNHLKIGSYFNVDEFDSNSLMNCFENKIDSELDDVSLRNKLLTLLVCCTDRFADDLARIVVDSVEIEEDNSKISYRLARGDSIGAKQVVSNEIVSKCWIEYHQRRMVYYYI